MEFSIIICTCNSAQRLPLTLDSIKRLVIPENAAGELIVVDNNSTDDTKSVIENFAPKMPLPLRYCFEPDQGLSHARNTGIDFAKGRLIIFTDDDCIVDANWIIEILAAFRSDPELAILGGRVERYSHADKPVTLRQLNEERRFSTPQQVFTLLPGCNMAFRRSVVDMVGKFDVNFGAGKKIPSAEDSDFFYRAYRLGYKMVYLPKVLIFHNHGRRTNLQVDKLTRGYVIGQGAFYCKHLLKGDATVRRLFLNELKRNIKAILVNLAQCKTALWCFNRLHALMTGFWYQLLIFLRDVKAI